MKAPLIKIREIETNETLYHVGMGEDTLCGIMYVDPDDGFEVLVGKDGTLQDVTCPRCLAVARYIRSIDEQNDNPKQPYKQRKMCKKCYNWLSQEDVEFNDFPHCSNADDVCREYLDGSIKRCPKILIL